MNFMLFCSCLAIVIILLRDLIFPPVSSKLGAKNVSHEQPIESYAFGCYSFTLCVIIKACTEVTFGYLQRWFSDILFDVKHIWLKLEWCNVQYVSTFTNATGSLVH